MEVSARRNATSPGAATSVCRRRLRTVVASLALQSPGPSWCPGLGHLLASPANCCVWPQDLEPTTNGPPITRTVARFIQAPAQDPLVCCSNTRQCWLQLRVSCCDCTASSAPTTNVLQTRLDSTDSTDRRSGKPWPPAPPAAA